MTFYLPQLPFDPTKLKPYLSEDAISTHYHGHHQAYVDKVNKYIVEEDLEPVSLESIVLSYDGQIFNNAAQAWNHTFLWHCLSVKNEPPQRGDLSDTVKRSFGSWEDMKKDFIENGMKVFGSGWTWLVVDGHQNLEFLNTQNAGTPLRDERVRPLWTCDVWEHAYYIDYRNKRQKYLENAWDHVNWAFVENNLRLGSAPNMTQFMTEDPTLSATRNFQAT